jgi:hypothetical protein
VIPATKLDSIRAAWAAGDRLGALRIAARFFDRSGATKAFKRGMDAHNNPGFYRQLGKDPDLLLRTALELLPANSVCDLPPSRDNVPVESAGFPCAYAPTGNQSRTLRMSASASCGHTAELT